MPYPVLLYALELPIEGRLSRQLQPQRISPTGFPIGWTKSLPSVSWVDTYRLWGFWVYSVSCWLSHSIFLTVDSFSGRSQHTVSFLVDAVTCKGDRFVVPITVKKSPNVPSASCPAVIVSLAVVELLRTLRFPSSASTTDPIPIIMDSDTTDRAIGPSWSTALRIAILSYSPCFVGWATRGGVFASSMPFPLPLNHLYYSISIVEVLIIDLLCSLCCI